ncbi:HNH endonuclease [Nitrosococcus halophilus Nc 4]|uniref:HNH endonuclease n=1 Tax=Nitrosococcus halophilus (strain Nc4) TaxID=472759 RepID=D5BYA5_NITHN|nr:RNA-guided endonuclease IscB [Nitrosococcus halophilus]ADE14088.1 HNH endonuclease [Nitrosococcus halophilus Nc 4]
MNSVFVLDTDKTPLMPCRPSRARRLLRDGRAAVFRMQPFTVILKYRVVPTPQPVEFKVDPGSKTTGMALVGHFSVQGRVVLWAANLMHRGQSVRDRLERRRLLRRGRRGRKTRYRAPRFLNRTRPQGWLAPSLRSRVENVSTWFNRLLDRAPISACHIETVRFDLQKIQNPEISGVEYQQGELQGYEVREYVLEKWGRKCAYCHKTNIPLEIEHLVPRSRGGSHRVSNLTLACTPCNQKKNSKTAAEFGYPHLQTKANQPLKDAAAVNATRYAIGRAIQSIGLPTSFWSGGRTKKNRLSQGYAKDHWIDAACVGESGEQVTLAEGDRPLQIKATGRGTRQVVRTDKYGFPRGKAGRCKRVKGFQTGDRVRLIQPKGKYEGAHTGILAGIRANGVFDIKAKAGKISANWKNFKLIQRGEGYDYGLSAV